MIIRIRNNTILQAATFWLLCLGFIVAPVTLAASELCSDQSDAVMDCGGCEAMMPVHSGSHPAEHLDSHSDAKPEIFPGAARVDCHANAFCAPDYASDSLGAIFDQPVPAIMGSSAESPSTRDTVIRSRLKSPLIATARSLNCLYCRYLI